VLGRGVLSTTVDDAGARNRPPPRCAA
jgi:hypothetical protein